MRQIEAAEGGDPLPFTTRQEGEKTYVFLPTEINGIEEKSKKALALVLGLCKIADFQIEGSRRVIDINDFSNTLEVSEKALLGAFYCLSRDEIVPTNNIPKEYNTGWEYAQWYAFAKATNDLDWGEYLSIPRVTTLLPSLGAAWSGGRQFTTLQRLIVLIRLAAQKVSYKVKNILLFLKNLGYFKMRFVGKKPIGGLYLTEEHELLIKEWEDRNIIVENLYQGIPRTLKLPLAQGMLKQYMGKFNIGLTPMSKKVEECARSRIPNLLVQVGTGRQRRTVIAKGGNLPEKLRNDSINHTVRTIGKVLWSPLFKGVTQNLFTDMALRYTRKRLHSPQSNLTAEEELIRNECNTLTANPEVGSVLYGTLATAASVYLEIYPDYTGNPAWDTALGGLPRE
jgi:hypothetical protein